MPLSEDAVLALQCTLDASEAAAESVDSTEASLALAMTTLTLDEALSVLHNQLLVSNILRSRQRVARLITGTPTGFPNQVAALLVVHAATADAVQRDTAELLYARVDDAVKLLAHYRREPHWLALNLTPTTSAIVDEALVHLWQRLLRLAVS